MVAGHRGDSKGGGGGGVRLSSWSVQKQKQARRIGEGIHSSTLLC